jgi:hypothetical protein
VSSGERRAVRETADPTSESECLSEFPSESTPIAPTAAPATTRAVASARRHLHPRNLLLVIGLMVLAGGVWELLDVVRQSRNKAGSLSSTRTVEVAAPAPLTSTAFDTTTESLAPYVRSVNRSIVFEGGSLSPIPAVEPRASAASATLPSVAPRSFEPVRPALPSEATLLAPIAETSAAVTTAAFAGAVAPVGAADDTMDAVAESMELETQAVRDTLTRYESALEDLSVTTTAEVWPSVDRAMLARAFATLKSQGITLGSCVFAIAENDASARCRGSVWFVPKIGRSEPRESPQDWVFKLKKVGDEWKIDQVTATVSPSPNRPTQHR